MEEIEPIDGPLSLPDDLTDFDNETTLPQTPVSVSGPLTIPGAPAYRSPGDYREFGDTRVTRNRIYEDVLNAANETAPISNGRHTLRLTGVRYVDPEKYTRRQQKEAILGSGTLGRRMKGIWELSDDATGETIDRRESIVGRVPFMTHRGTFINNGSEYTLNHQQRLLPSVFTRRKGNDEIESHVNVLPGKGVSHRYFLDPAKGTFKMRIGQSEVPLLPILRVMGATDAQLKEVWGPEILAANYKHDDASAAKKVAARMLSFKDKSDDPDESTTRQRLKAKLESTELDPEVTRHTLGKAYKNLSLDAMLDTTKKLLAVQRGEAEVDDRDDLSYQTFLGPEDLFSERVRRDHGRTRQELLRKASMSGNLSKVSSGALTKQIEQAIMGSGLAQVIEEINPSEIFDKQSRVTRLGEGGIGSLDSIPAESRNVQSSYLGFIDPLRTPESLRAGIDSNMARGARKGRDGRIYSRYHDHKTGEEVWKSPQEVADLVVAFPGMDAGAKPIPEELETAYRDVMHRQKLGIKPAKQDVETVATYEAMKSAKPDKRVPVMKGGKITYARREDVDLVSPAFEDAFSPMGNLVPLKSMVKGQRVAMASRMLTQALPLVGGEAPLVQGATPEDSSKSFEDEYGKHMGAVRADKPGIVVGLENGVAKLQFDDGTTDDVELYENFPFNRKSVSGSSTVQVLRSDGTVWSGCIADYHRLTGDRVRSYDPVTCQSAWSVVTGFVAHRCDKKLYRVTLRSGRSLTVTEDHSLLTLDADGLLTPIFAEACVIGKTRLPLVMMPELSADVSSHTPAGFDLAWLGRLAGLYLAEGHIPDLQPNLIVISVKDQARHRQVKQLCQDLSPHRRDTDAVIFSHAVLSTWLRRECGHLAHNKRLPVWALSAPAAFRTALLQGYMAGDGCLWEDANGALQLEAASVSRALRDDLVDLLATFGILATIRKGNQSTVNPNWRDAYWFRVTSGHVAKLPEPWFFYDDRNHKLAGLLKETYRASLFETVPLPKGGRRGLYADLKATIGKVPPFIYKTASLGFVAKWRVANLPGRFGLWGQSDVCWDIVESVEQAPHEDEVYDFCVAGSEAFAVNGGVLVHNTYLHQTMMVKPGDRFDKNQLLAKSNYTDDSGSVALGLNARVAYMPYKGYNFEDAVVISDAMAKRLKSEHMYQHDLEVDDRTKVGKKAFISLFPQKFDRQILDTLDDDGVVKIGQTVEYGQPLILSARQQDRAENKIHKKRQAGFNDNTVLWNHHDAGVVTDVVQGKKGPVVLVKSTSTMQVGDKLSGRMGDKGVISAIVPDHQMPHDKDGTPYEVLLNPLGIVSRTNPSQMIEAWLGKVAKKTGKPVKVKDFDNVEDMTEWARQELKKHGVSDTDDVTLPDEGVTVGNVATGNRFFMKLHHTSESKSQGRGGGAYSADEAPSKGGETGCFAGNTPVVVRRVGCGGLTSTYETTIGWLVAERCADVEILSHDGVSPCWRPVTDWFEFPASALVEIELVDGAVLQVTSNHLMYLADGTTKLAGDLEQGDDLLEAK